MMILMIMTVAVRKAMMMCVLDCSYAFLFLHSNPQ